MPSQENAVRSARPSRIFLVSVANGFEPYGKAEVRIPVTAPSYIVAGGWIGITFILPRQPR